MERHLLVTVSEDQSYLWGVRFVGDFFAHKQDLRFTLFYTAPRPAEVWGEERSYETLKLAEEMERHTKERGRAALERAKEVLCHLGAEPDQVNTKLILRRHSKFMDILQEGAKGLYDAVVLGRRAMLWLEESIQGSVTKSIFEGESSSPIWLCKRPEHRRRNVLACVDGSAAAERIVDHVGFILAKEPAHAITLLTVIQAKGKGTRDPDEVLARARDILHMNDIPDARIGTRVEQSTDPAKTILTAAEQDKFAAVAVGRTGVGKGLLARLLIGSVSETLFKRLDNAALFVCR
jgi:nucleotide-binding universal stress UspA family protein